MSAEIVMIGLPLVVLLLGLGVLLMAYVGSVRTPMEAPPAQPDMLFVKRLTDQLDRLMQSSETDEAPRPETPRPAASPSRSEPPKGSGVKKVEEIDVSG